MEIVILAFVWKKKKKKKKKEKPKCNLDIKYLMIIEMTL